MSTIREIFESSLTRVCQSNLIGIRSGQRKDWYWTFKSDKERDIIRKLKLILSWVMGSQVLHMTNQDVLKYTIEEYKKCNYYGFLGLKYGEYHF